MAGTKVSRAASRPTSMALLAWMLAVVMFIMGSDLNIVSPLLSPISQSFHVRLAAAGWLVTAFAGGYALGSPVSGWMSDRVGRLSTLAGGMVGFVLFETASALAPGLWQEIGVRALAGVFAGAVSPIAYALIGDIVPKPQRAGTMSVLSMGFSAATVAGVPLGLGLAAWVGWRGALLAIGIALTLAGLPLWAVLRPIQPRPSVSRRRAPRSIAWLRGLWPGLFASFTAFAAMGAIYTYLPVVLVRRGLPQYPWLIAALAVYGAFNLAGNRFFGWRGDRVGAPAAVRQGQLLETAVLAVMVAIAYTRQLDILMAASWIFAFSQAYIPDLKAMASDVPARVRGTSLAINNTAMYGGMVAGSALANALYPSGGFFTLSLLALGLVGSGWVGMLIGSTGRKRMPQRA